MDEAEVFLWELQRGELEATENNSDTVSRIPKPDDPGMPCVCPPGLKQRKLSSIRSQQNTNPRLAPRG